MYEMSHIHDSVELASYWCVYGHIMYRDLAALSRLVVILIVTAQRAQRLWIQFVVSRRGLRIVDET